MFGLHGVAACSIYSKADLAGSMLLSNARVQKNKMRVRGILQEDYIYIYIYIYIYLIYTFKSTKELKNSSWQVVRPLCCTQRVENMEPQVVGQLP